MSVEVVCACGNVIETVPDAPLVDEKNRSGSSSSAGSTSSTSPTNSTGAVNLTGIRLFKSIVRRVRNIVTENRKIGNDATSASGTGTGTNKHCTNTGCEFAQVMAKLETISLEDQSLTGKAGDKGGDIRSPSPKDTIKKFFGSVRFVRSHSTSCSGELKSRTWAGYGSDSGSVDRCVEESREKMRPKMNRVRSKSDSRQNKKKAPKRILRTPPTYVYMKGISGLPTQRIRVR